MYFMKLYNFLFCYVAIGSFCYGNQDFISQFKDEWKLFVDTNNITQSDAGDNIYQEFALIEKFGFRQLARLRDPIKGVDRFEDWVPYKDNRITLSDGSEASASLVFPSIQKDIGYHSFIASQAPMKSNISNFWKLVWERGIEQIVMTTELYEDDGEELCVAYWPVQIDKNLICENGIEVSLIEKNWLLAEEEENIQIQRFNVSWRKQERIVTHYWYHNWPHDAAPREPESIIALIKTVQGDKVKLNAEVPILAHCAAGVGRTGVFIALYHLVQRAIVGSPYPLSLFDLVAHLRWQRRDMVGELSQYEFCFRVFKNFSFFFPF